MTYLREEFLDYLRLLRMPETDQNPRWASEVGTPDVRQAAAVGYPDDRLGERVCAFVVATGTFDLDACRAWFEAQGIARYKTPERVVQVDELPLLAAGKADRAALRERAAV